MSSLLPLRLVLGEYISTNACLAAMQQTYLDGVPFVHGQSKCNPAFACSNCEAVPGIRFASKVPQIQRSTYMYFSFDNGIDTEL